MTRLKTLNGKSLKPFIFSSLILNFFTLLPSAVAVESINVQTFNPSVSDHFVLLEDGFKSEWPKISKFYFGANYNYVDTPLVAVNAAGSAKAFDVIKSIQTFDVFFGFKPASHFGLFIGMPIHSVTYPDFPSAGFPGGSTTVLGDLKIEGKIRLTSDTSDTAIALIPEIHLPTGSTENFVSDASSYLGLRMAIEHTYQTFTLTGNLGFGVAPNSIYRGGGALSDIDYRKRMMLGIGGFLPFTDQWGMNLEFNSIHMVPFDANENPNELYTGLRYAATDSFIFTLGGSLGKIGGPTGNTYRVIAGIRYTFSETEKETPAPKPIVAATPSPTPEATPVPVETPVVSATPAPKAIMRARHIEILSPIEFENDSDRLTHESKTTLNDVATIMIKNQKNFKKVQVDGHTNKIGTDAYNLKLSLARAKSVKKYLLSRKVPAKILEARGFGERKPKVPESDPRSVELNRRVEFIVIK